MNAAYTLDLLLLMLTNRTGVAFSLLNVTDKVVEVDIWDKYRV